jgi:hypothetical protein
MALSNIFREPRRELIEQGVGLVGFTGLVLCDQAAAAIMCLVVDGTTSVEAAEWAVASAMAIPLGFMIVGVMVLMHAAGEALCNSLQSRGVHLRPRQRY